MNEIFSMAGACTPDSAPKEAEETFLGVGDSLPDFSLQTATGEAMTRADLLGKGPVVIYFYPKDETMGCTAQACSFRDHYAEFQAAGAEIIGVSADSVASHQAFAENHGLPFTLLADPNNTLREAFGVPETLGFLAGRVTYICDNKGIIRHVFDSQIRVYAHVDAALEVVKALANAE